MSGAEVDSFLKELSTLERTAELGRILAAFKLNALDVLNVSHTATREDVQKAYRAASLQVHPDKFSEADEKAKAQQAFTLLTAAKDELLDEAKRETLDELIDQARQRVLTNKAAEGKVAAKKRRLEDHTAATAAASTGAGPASAALAAAAASAAAEPIDASKDPLFDRWVRDEVKEIVMEREWKKRQLLKAAAAEDALAAEEKARRLAEREEKKSQDKEWEDGRETRINSWRDFQTKGKKRRMGMPKLSQADENNSFVKRPVQHGATSAGTGD